MRLTNSNAMRIYGSLPDNQAVVSSAEPIMPYSNNVCQAVVSSAEPIMPYSNNVCQAVVSSAQPIMPYSNHIYINAC